MDDIETWLRFDSANARTVVAPPKPRSSWCPVDLGPALRNELTRPIPTILKRDDGTGLFYAGQVNGIHGESGIGKTWVAVWAAAEVITERGSVIWIDAEEPTSATLIERLRLSGLTDTHIEGQLAYIAPAEPSDEAAVANIITAARRMDDLRLVVLDSVGELFGLDGINENDDGEVAPWFRRMPRTIVDQTGAAVILVDHSTKARDAPLYPSGSKRKRAAITGAQYLVKAHKPFTRTADGQLALICAKDRAGHHQIGTDAAHIHIRPTSPDGLTTITAPSSALRPLSELVAPNSPEHVTEAVLRVLRDTPEPLTRTDVRNRVGSRTKEAGAEIDKLIADGTITNHGVLRRNTRGQDRPVSALVLADGTGWQPDQPANATP